MEDFERLKIVTDGTPGGTNVTCASSGKSFLITALKIEMDCNRDKPKIFIELPPGSVDLELIADSSYIEFVKNKLENGGQDGE